jgi:predicted amidohydrolase
MVFYNVIERGENSLFRLGAGRQSGCQRQENACDCERAFHRAPFAHQRNADRGVVESSAMRTRAILVWTAFAVLLPHTAAAGSGGPPRKVIVGTAMQAYWGEYPGLDRRLGQLTALVDEMAAASVQRYGRGIDLAVLPETAVTGENTGDPVEHSFPFEGAVRDAFARKARERHCYIVVPMFLRENGKVCTNAAVLVGRNGELVGIYRKVHLAVNTGSDSMEGGMTPGKDVPVFACDFGKLGIQICFDMEFDYGWQELARKGAELVAWPTQSPQTAHPASRAMQNRSYIVSSTWRDNASIFEPTGKIVAQIRSPQQVLVQELDLSYAILPWRSKLQNGAALTERYGARAGFHYYADEDKGIFWSNDPKTTIGEMIRSLGLSEAEPELQRIKALYRKAGVPGN